MFPSQPRFPGCKQITRCLGCNRFSEPIDEHATHFFTEQMSTMLFHESEQLMSDIRQRTSFLCSHLRRYRDEFPSRNKFAEIDTRRRGDLSSDLLTLMFNIFICNHTGSFHTLFFSPTLMSSNRVLIIYLYLEGVLDISLAEPLSWRYFRESPSRVIRRGRNPRIFYDGIHTL